MYNLNSIENNQSAIKRDTYFDAKGCFIVGIKQIFDIFKILPAFSWMKCSSVARFECRIKYLPCCTFG